MYLLFRLYIILCKTPKQIIVIDGTFEKFTLLYFLYECFSAKIIAFKALNAFCKLI